MSVDYIFMAAAETLEHSMDLALYRYGRQLNTHDALKIVATVLMVVDHIGLVTQNEWLRMMGRGSAPIFYFLIGYNGKIHVNAFIVIYGLILSYTWTTISHNLWINILLTFIVLHVMFKVVKPESQSTISRILGFVFLVVASWYVYPMYEYGFLGVLLAFAARSLALKERSAPVWILASLTVFGVFQVIFLRFLDNPYRIAGTGVIFVVLFFLLYRYQVRTLPCPTVIRVPALMIARYSLHIYFYHFLILQLVFFM